jgi:hypothetical protein
MPDVVTAADAYFPDFGAYGAVDPDINSTRVQSWNVIIERQIGTAWQASASYLGSYTDRLWGQVQLNPGVFRGLGPCTIAGVAYPSCTVAGNLEQCRALFLTNPVTSQLGPIDLHDDVGKQDYRALKLSVQRRAASGLRLGGNYTLSRCMGNTVTSTFQQIGAGYLKPDDPAFNIGHCLQDRTHIGNITVGAETPQFEHAALRALASDWRVSGILNARSGSWLTVTTGRDIAGTGIQNQRVNEVTDRPYGDKSLQNYLTPTAFAYPDAGTLGDHKRGSIEGPGYGTIDMAISRIVAVTTQQNVELRFEVFKPAEQFQLGRPGHEPRRGQLRPDYYAGRRPADYAIRDQVRVLGGNGGWGGGEGLSQDAGLIPKTALPPSPSPPSPLIREASHEALRVTPARLARQGSSEAPHTNRRRRSEGLRARVARSVWPAAWPATGVTPPCLRAFCGSMALRVDRRMGDHVGHIRRGELWFPHAF